MKTVAVLLACGVTTALTIDMAGAQGAQSYPFEGIWAQTATADGCRIAGSVYNRAYVRSTSDDDDSCKVNKVESQPDFGRKLARRLAHHGSILPGVGISSKPRAVQLVCPRETNRPPDFARYGLKGEGGETTRALRCILPNLWSAQRAGQTLVRDVSLDMAAGRTTGQQLLSHETAVPFFGYARLRFQFSGD
ncbi:hypothetical protein NLM31_07175 [Bradyrhizobium sp. CCGUVB4N]|uniref:hypothetical protein n=1 Tax=Bradyrhizobium sp. CCGUVB4N TaxID=2949631 RepID=UPI0020B1C667|nr:hypothetical protein [Bradyrhizobium sp. CCGUVB4N]MCP3380191.1 hypothetical protein [Bradyrhizobium sp. CCGUVB4N]